MGLRPLYIPIYVQIPALTALANAQEYQVDPGFDGSLISIIFRTTVAVTTAAKLATLTARVNASAVAGGGVVALTSAAATPIGGVIFGSAITVGAANNFTRFQSVGFTVSAVTAFSEGAGIVELICSAGNVYIDAP